MGFFGANGELSDMTASSKISIALCLDSPDEGTTTYREVNTQSQHKYIEILRDDR